jgi:hypothetical protein
MHKVIMQIVNLYPVFQLLIPLHYQKHICIFIQQR